MLVSVTIRGLRTLRRHIATAARNLQSRMDQNLRLASELIVEEAVREGFQGSRTRARRKKRPVTAPPRKLGIDTGFYRQAIGYSIGGPTRSRTSEVGPAGVAYARAHEFGIGHMPKRPVIGPAVSATEDKVFKLIGKTFEVL